MAAQRRQESLWWFERQRESLLQQSQSGEAWAQSPAAGRRVKEEVILCPDDRDEEEADLCQDCQRPEQPD